MTGWLLLRVVLFAAFRPSGISTAEALEAFAVGFQRDFFMAMLETLPLLLWFGVISNQRFASTAHRKIVLTASFCIIFAQLFLLCVEFFFFEEFKSRFNTVAVDYLLYPQEVFVNIWESYHVGLVVSVCAVISFGWVLIAGKLFSGMWEQAVSTRARWLAILGVGILALLLSTTINFKGARVSNDRTLNELANNGGISFAAAAKTRHLEYSAYYKTLPRDEAYERTRRMLSGSNVVFETAGNSIRRRINGDPGRPKLNVVILLEESLGSEFWGCLGRANTLTPEMDKLAVQEGILFTNLYASGNRTVRGMEGVLSSFPPLPGDSIVKRDLTDNVETVARVLRRDGYSTVFLYGGRGFFDGMRSYALRNGYDRFIEQKHFSKPTFTTAWGVCDEDLFDRGIEELRELNKSGKPFFATFLSVSNHKPYTYPKGRIPENPDAHKRAHAVKYSDYALGQFFEKAKKETFWTNTVFAVVADHGDRVYGRQSIPIHSYEIPLVILGPAVVKEPMRIGQVGGSLDVGPTLLGLVGRPYDSLFFGRDLLKVTAGEGRALLNHNRDIGMLAHDRLVVLGLMGTTEYYAGDPKQVDVSLMKAPSELEREIEQDTISIYQVADELYTHSAYRIDPQPTEASTVSKR